MAELFHFLKRCWCIPCLITLLRCSQSQNNAGIYHLLLFGWTILYLTTISNSSPSQYITVDFHEKLSATNQNRVWYHLKAPKLSQMLTRVEVPMFFDCLYRVNSLYPIKEHRNLHNSRQFRQFLGFWVIS